MTDDNVRPFADGSATVSAEMMDAYLQGKLPPEQQAEFEAFIMDQPELLEQAELGLLMQEGFRAHEAAAQVPPADVAPQWRLAAAAALVSIGLGSIIGYSVGGGDAAQNGLGAGLQASQIVNLPVTRSEARRTEVDIGGDTELVILRVPLPDPESRAYAVEVSGDAGPVGGSVRIRPDGGGVLTLAVSAADLVPGEYSIVIDDGRDVAPLTLGVTLER